MNEDNALVLIMSEYSRARRAHPPFNSLHEGYAVLLEEVDELWDEIKKNPSKRSALKLREEAVQVAAIALAILVECIPETVE